MPDWNSESPHLYCREQGSGPALLFLHSLGASSHVWTRQLDRFGRDCRAVAPDLRGHGRSPAPDGMALEQLEDDLVGLLDHLGLDQVTLVGQSLGGILAVRLYARVPERVRGLMIGSMAASYTPERISQRLEQATALVRQKGMAAVAAEYAETTLQNAAHRPALAEVMGAMRPEDYLGVLGAVFRGSVEAILPQVRVPTLVYWGSEDWRTPRTMLEHIARHVPGAELAVIPGAGHLCHLDNPDEFDRLLSGFLTRLNPA